MLRRPLFRQYDQSSGPARLLCDPFLPIEFRQTWFLANVVSSPRSLVRCCREGDSVSDVFHVPSRCSPSGQIVGKQYVGPLIRDAFQQRKETMKRVAWAIHHSTAVQIEPETAEGSLKT